MKTQKRHCRNSRYIKCAKNVIVKICIYLASTKNDALQIAYLASLRCKSMPENAFDILKTVHLVKTQKRHCQNLRFIKYAKMALVKICTFSSLPQQSSFQQNESVKLLIRIQQANLLPPKSQFNPVWSRKVLISLIHFVGMNFVVETN